MHEPRIPTPFRHLIRIPFAGRVGNASLPKTASYIA